MACFRTPVDYIIKWNLILAGTIRIFGGVGDVLPTKESDASRSIRAKTDAGIGLPDLAAASAVPKAKDSKNK